MKEFREFKIFRATSNSQVSKFTESQIILARSPEDANEFARKWASELVEYGAEEVLKPPHYHNP